MLGFALRVAGTACCVLAAATTVCFGAGSSDPLFPPCNERVSLRPSASPTPPLPGGSTNEKRHDVAADAILRSLNTKWHFTDRTDRSGVSLAKRILIAGYFNDRKKLYAFLHKHPNGFPKEKEKKELKRASKWTGEDDILEGQAKAALIRLYILANWAKIDQLKPSENDGDSVLIALTKDEMISSVYAQFWGGGVLAEIDSKSNKAVWGLSQEGKDPPRFLSKEQGLLLVNLFDTASTKRARLDPPDRSAMAFLFGFCCIDRRSGKYRRRCSQRIQKKRRGLARLASAHTLGERERGGPYSQGPPVERENRQRRRRHGYRQPGADAHIPRKEA
jgi:hypothetical protein